MEVVFHPRSEWTDRIPDSNSGAIRPLMQKDRPYQTVHYTGVSWHRSNDQLRYSPIIKSDVMVLIENVADAGQKSFEYNYVIPFGIRNQCHIWEYAGLYQAAHSQGENHLSFGCLLLLGVDAYGTPNQVWQPCSDEMVYAIRWINKYLRDRGYLSVNHQILPHTQMPEANTPCPGDPAIARIPEMRQPLIDEPPEIPDVSPPILPPVGDSMLMRTYQPTFQGAGDNPYLAFFDSGIVRPLVSDDLTPKEPNPKTNGAWPIPDKGQYERICKWAKIEVILPP